MYRPYICPFDEILKEVGYGKSVFDIGCGSGMFLSLCAEYIKPKKLAGIEIQNNLVDNSKSLLSKYKMPVSLKVFDGKSIPQEISDYDVITMIDVLHHIPVDEQISFLKGVIKKMKKGSNLIIKDINKDNLLVFFNKLHDLIFSKQIGNEIGFVKLRSILDQESVEIISYFEKTVLVYPHYFISLRKK